MKFTIYGFDQENLINLGLDLNDAAILRYFIDFKNSGKMRIKNIEGEKYYWIKYAGIVSYLPIMKLKKDSVYRRLKKIVEKGVLKHKTVKECGCYSYYAPGERYAELVEGKKIREMESDTDNLYLDGFPEEMEEGSNHSEKNQFHREGDSSHSEIHPFHGDMDTKHTDINKNPKDGSSNAIETDTVESENIPYTEENNSERGSSRIPQGLEKCPVQSINLLKDSSIKKLNKKNNYSDSNIVYKLLYEYGFAKATYYQRMMIDEDIEKYGVQRVAEAVEEAARQGVYKLYQVEDILETWKKNNKRHKEESSVCTNVDSGEKHLQPWEMDIDF